MRSIFRKVCGSLLFFISINCLAQSNVTYQPTHDSISQHAIPDWYEDAKFGIMIHYGLYTIPAWASLFNPVGKIFTNEFFFNNPYSAWYLNSMQIKNSPTQIYHQEHYGSSFTYDDFVPLFNKEASKVNFDDWATLFKSAGAKYAVLVTKHHDGFLLWPSKYKNPYKPTYVAERNIVNDFAVAIRKQNLRLGLYYSGGYDWSWQEQSTPPITDWVTALEKIPQTQAYADYVDHQWHELINLFHPDLIWNDIALPALVNKYQLFADYYNAVPDGVANNRWAQTLNEMQSAGQPSDDLLNKLLKTDWFDYYSAEYLTHYLFTIHKWEADHAPGYDFSYNKNEYTDLKHFETADQLIADLADIVSKNGNFLLGIGPKADGSIPKLEKNILLQMGDWLEKNGEAIYATRPWIFPEGKVFTSNKTIPVRFTRSKGYDALYIILLKNPKGEDVSIPNLFVLDKKTQITVLNGVTPYLVNWVQAGSNLKINLSKNIAIPHDHPLAIKISPMPI